MATILRTNGTRERLFGEGPQHQTPAEGGGFHIEHELTLEQLNAAVGGYIEIVMHRTSIGTLKPGMLLVVNGEGMLRGLPTNVAASLLAGQPIVGDVVLASTSEVT